MAFPDIDPIAFRILGFGVYWYALAYIAGITLGFRVLLRTNRHLGTPFSKEILECSVNWMILGIIIGGRLGHVLYEPELFWKNPSHIFAIRQGGMSFHGGLLGILVAAGLFSWRQQVNFWRFMDLLATGTPIGLFLGRCANFVNGELYGHPTTLPWGIVFPKGGPVARHPSQLYEALSEGLFLGGLLSFLAWTRGPSLAPGRLAGVFALGYGTIRIVLETFRAPDSVFNAALSETFHLTLGQILSFPLIFLGGWLLKRRL
jgi:phosphatidylglycerol:prolipoprotein diacylglycerol transferase